MMRSGLSLLPTVVLSLSLLGAVTADKHNTRRHHVQLNRLPTERDNQVERRFDNARLSYYEAGQGACGQVNSDSDYIVALNSDQYDGGSHCFEQITITYNGKSTTAQIADECPGCPYGGLDLTPGLFSFFASTDAGIIYGEWDFGSGAAETTTSTYSPTPTPTSTYVPPPTTTSTPTTTWTPTTTSTKTTHSTTSTPPPTTSTTPSSTWTPSSSSASSSSVVPSSSSAPSSSVVPSSSSEASKTSDPAPSSSTSSDSPSSSAAASVTGGLAQLNQAFVQIAVLAAGAQ